jgi:CheY-like chemotaxis protein
MTKLLLLDDEPETLEWMAAALSTFGNEVRSFTSGREALAQLADWHPDLIISDILMPEIDGFAFARLAHALGSPPIMFISIAMKRAEAVLAGAVGYVQKPATADEVRSAVASVLGHERRRATILVVDDDPEVRELYASYLQPGFEIVDAVDGLDALAKLGERPVDLVITDYHMPHMNGLELIRALRADEQFERIPVIVQTSDHVALRSPVWRELGVAHKLDKVDFFRWLRRNVQAHVAEDTSAQPHA